MKYSTEVKLKAFGIATCLLVMVSCFLPIYTLPIFSVSRNLISVFATDTYILIGLGFCTAAAIFYSRFLYISTFMGLCILGILFNVIKQKDVLGKINPDLGISVLLLLLCALFLVSYPFIFNKRIDSLVHKQNKSSNNKDEANQRAQLSMEKVKSSAVAPMQFTIWPVKNLKKFVPILLIPVLAAIGYVWIPIYESKSIDRKSSLLACFDGYEEFRNSEGMAQSVFVTDKKIFDLTKVFNFGVEWEVHLNFSANSLFERVECRIFRDSYGKVQKDLNWVKK